MAKVEEPKVESGSVGGLAFFSSLLFLSLLAAFNFSILPQLWFGDAPRRFSYMLLGCIPGAFVSLYILQGKYNVLIHEFKHSIVSGLVGNRFRGMKVHQETGKFTYSYTKRTAAYNAFIALGPYWVPLFTFILLLLGLAVSRHDTTTLAIIVGVGVGADFVLNTRDISPHQSDFSIIRGGFPVGLSYVIAMNACVLSFLSAWILQGLPGLLYLLKSLWNLLLLIVLELRA